MFTADFYGQNNGAIMVQQDILRHLALPFMGFTLVVLYTEGLGGGPGVTAAPPVSTRGPTDPQGGGGATWFPLCQDMCVQK